jgi:hypothetical protein
MTRFLPVLHKKQWKINGKTLCSARRRSLVYLTYLFNIIVKNVLFANTGVGRKRRQISLTNPPY